MNDSLKQKTISGMIWSGVQRFGTLGISFISNMVLARMLSPDDFGCIGMLMIFIAISNTFIDGGFGSALIQKKEPTQNDYSTIFYWNIFLSVVLYGVMYLAAPFIAEFYHIALLSDVLRVQGVVLIINAFSIIQSNQLRKRLQFKKLASINVAAALVSVCVAITLAFLGWGVWSLVAQQLSLGFFTALFLWIFNRWKPALVFSWRSFKELFGFGSFILLSNLINTLFNNLNGLLIGRYFTSATMGYFTQAKKIEEVSATSIASVIEQVSYPVLVEMQNDKLAMQNSLRRFNASLLYIVMPIMFLLLLMATSITVLLFGEKWIPAVPILQILSIQGVFICIQGVNYNAVAALGESKKLFNWTIIKRVLGIITLIGGMYIGGINGLLWGMVLTSFIICSINALLVAKLVGYKLKNQFLDLLPTITLATIPLIIVLAIRSQITMNVYSLDIISGITYVVIYLTTSIILKVESLKMFQGVLKQLLHRRK